MIHFVLHDAKDNVAVVVVEGVTAGMAMTGWIMDEDRMIDVQAQQDIPIGHKVALELGFDAGFGRGTYANDVATFIARKIVEIAQPRWLRIGGYWYPRGGIPIDVFWQTGPAPEGLWVPDQGVAPYRGRG